MLAEQFHRLRERRGQALAWAKASEAAGMNYAFTVNPDVYSVPGRSPGGVINCLCKELFQELNVCLRGLSRRQANAKRGSTSSVSTNSETGASWSTRTVISRSASNRRTSSG